MSIEDKTQDVFGVDRPWGDFRSFCQNEQVTVKVITVRPGQRLSLQKHGQRAEMWTVLDDAPMQITVDDRTWEASQGELIWVPQGAVHRMANTGDREARILEVGFGHFDEDDIERLEDDYQRA
ncbi:Alginate biosynthesis protein AlgA [Austwickia sp. TVS 96-490-7B]|uniref:phosphomannose isomerase type II C-terminal cupin domain n=1 Tax=Austwickia sp. TVS 96-490-7B TaxID=2830843 RepID=UPI001C563938|nr:phosphomannose isomerase type II C-terminal cupin domain [Austwickia sp. TVS 96-490-7B]MBW3083853.1 Alginate biosynthesis protein AlgA [Austwickia sp. TVS 96-490-7B]